MSNFAAISDVAGRQAAASDYASWTKIDPATPGDRDGVILQNRSAALWLHVRLVGINDAEPTGSTTTTHDFQLPPDSEPLFLAVGAGVGIYGLHAAPVTAGSVCRETK